MCCSISCINSIIVLMIKLIVVCLSCSCLVCCCRRRRCCCSSLCFSVKNLVYSSLYDVFLSSRVLVDANHIKPYLFNYYCCDYCNLEKHRYKTTCIATIVVIMIA